MWHIHHKNALTYGYFCLFRQPLHSRDEDFARARKAVRLSLSLGVTSLRHRKGGADIDSLIRNADSALYSAKQTDRNRICISGGRGITHHPPGR